MGVFVPIPGGVQAELVFVSLDVVCENRLWFTFDTPPITGADLTGLANGLADWHTTYVMPYLSRQYTLARIDLRTWDTPPTGLPFTYVVGQIGGVDEEPHSANVAVVVPFRWPLGFREKRNKNYIPGVPLSAVNLNTVTDTFSEAMREAYSALIDAARDWEPALHWRWRVASAFDGGSARSEQLVRSSQGPVLTVPYRLGQRRRRLP